MKSITTYELSPTEYQSAYDVARDLSRGFTVDRIVDRAQRVADALGYDIGTAQVNAILDDINERDRTSSCGLDGTYERDAIVKGVLAAMRTEKTVKVTPFVREHTVETVRKTKTLKAGGIR